MAYQAKRKRKDGGKPRTYRGKKVQDATSQPFAFPVTTQDCRNAKRGDPEACAGARAIKRSHPGDVVAVHVHRHFTYVEFPDKVIRYKTSHGLRDQVLRHDVKTSAFEPGVYTLRPVPPSVIKNRGHANSPPDRPKGAANSPFARKKALTMRNLGREKFYFTSENSDYK